ncbi:hypothetical protein BT96DRAFT_881491 [Gymnopus androsaceus JB14]|uniref:Uncharacterized protein n=1 Tax=Gymnopus androsaceus JB14 TaxID=1447944 RepID=A0A6A4HP21_9AGAR|nr:hypothetical protein BT96DRAFT_881491 [Gymnopus androsaceus JB14]
MIIDKVPEDAPPAYEDSQPSGSHLISSAYPFTSSQSQSHISPPISPGSPSFSSKGKGKAPVASSWWSFGTSQTTREIRTTVLGLVRDLVKMKSGNAIAAQSILESCAEACSGNSLSLSSLLQEKSIESHTPLYWAIVNRPSENSDEGLNGTSDLLTTLLSYTAPLSPDVLAEVRQACLIRDDQLLFQRFRLSPEFASLSGTDEMLLGESMIPDDVTVENLVGDEGAFAVNFRMPHFQKRMKVSNEVAVEFIARGRLWHLTLCVVTKRQRRTGHLPPGSWCITLSIRENSPPTWIDSRILFPDASFNGEDAGSPREESSYMFSGIMGDRKKPTISLRVQSDSELCSIDQRHNHHRQTQIVVPLDSVHLGSSLQHSGSSYIGADESLSGRLEARLTKPQAECIIC